MNMPGFSAELSVYKASNTYRGVYDALRSIPSTASRNVKHS
jgi:hypothetical protein